MILQQLLEIPVPIIQAPPLRAKAESLGSSGFSPLWAGQNTTGCKEVSATLLTRELSPVD
jgi:nitronate monooxygenase